MSGWQDARDALGAGVDPNRVARAMGVTLGELRRGLRRWSHAQRRHGQTTQEQLEEVLALPAEAGPSAATATVTEVGEWPIRHPWWCEPESCEFDPSTGVEGYHVGPRTKVSPAPGGGALAVRVSQLVDESNPEGIVGVRLRATNARLHLGPRITVHDLSGGEARALAALPAARAAEADRLSGGVR